MITSAAQNPGKMDRRIILRYPFTGRDSEGGVTTEWIEASTVWAAWLPQGSREFMAAQALHAEATGVFRIRHRSDIDSTWRAVKGDDLFEIIGVTEIGRREYLDLAVRALDQTTGSALRVRLLHDGSARLLHDSTPVLLHAA
jgi:SPP1 family predicted phage head-tail adaptor